MMLSHGRDRKQRGIQPQPAAEAQPASSCVPQASSSSVLHPCAAVQMHDASDSLQPRICAQRSTGCPTQETPSMHEVPHGLQPLEGAQSRATIRPTSSVPKLVAARRPGVASPRSAEPTNVAGSTRRHQAVEGIPINASYVTSTVAGAKENRTGR